jgi:hypothetical protein
MINGVHAIVHSREGEKLRSFFKDVLEWPFVDAGHGWLIFALPPGELGWGLVAQIELPDGSHMGLYPRHPVPPRS